MIARDVLLALYLLVAVPPAQAQGARDMPGTGAVGDGPATCVRGMECAVYDDPFHAGCGSRGGPGCRKPDGRCAAWREGFARDCRIPQRGG